MRMLALLFLIFHQGSFAKAILDHEICDHDFSALARGRSFEALTKLAKRLSKKDLKCLFQKSIYNGSPDIAFFQPTSTKEEFARIFGKNSLPFMNTFEKQVFSLKDQTFGYNFHQRMKYTGPGFFKVVSQDNGILIDFAANFEHEIKSADLSTFATIKIPEPRNNQHNLFYGGNTKDYCVRLLYDHENKRDIAVVCQGFRSFAGLRRAFIWDILIRKW